MSIQDDISIEKMYFWARVFAYISLIAALAGIVFIGGWILCGEAILLIAGAVSIACSCPCIIVVEILQKKIDILEDSGNVML